MKRVTIIIVVWLSFFSVKAQQMIEKHISFSGKESVNFDIQIADSINLLTWDKDEVYLKASVNVNDNKDNDAYLTLFDDSGKSIAVKAKIKDGYFKGKNNCCNTMDIFWTIYIPNKALFNIESINANITIVGQTEEMKVKSISGFIDLSVPADRNADIDFSTISGTIYSNLNLTPNQTHTSLPVKIADKLNNGGHSIRLETISGDIFFRKSDDK